MIAYHFVGKTLRDGRPIPLDGEWLVHGGDVEICQTGLHASKCPFDALQYAPGETLCLVECEEVVHEQDDKLVCRRRKIIKRIDTTTLMRYFARMQALSVIHLWDAPQVVLDYLMTGDESKRAAACAAAWAAAGAAASNAASNASWAAAWAAAGAAASNAASNASWAAAWAAAGAAASNEACGGACKEFRKLVDEEFAK